MSARLYVGNLPQSFETSDLDALFASVAEGLRFKPVMDRDTGASRGFGFMTVNDEAVADAIIEQLNGVEFGGNSLRIERSERRDSRDAGQRRPQSASAGRRPSVQKVVHSDANDQEAPDPRWAGELAKLKQLLDGQKAAV
ncbi:RNA-binding protein [Synechococcus sp. RSCCF101]|uniref:RNA recognition motif domain-containing protein n=1 Tax=Synechococcus sp. RSCCF101 TaxID=2511069 RepID=UPI0012450B9A|nr:RNA-binding protein [Synechococcus sp. RSCCF101]QEY32884.1 RNA-binding protein [Synechococcus sp. RSCCF101]